jgi:Flp pilus assembly protein TadD
MQKPGRLADAAAEYRRALRTRPGFAEAHNGLGNALAALGRTDEAVAEYREALRLRPAYAEIHFNLAMALLNAPGRRGEAAEQLEEFLLARPGNEAAWRILGQIRADRPAPP